jgi:hypothetical protein
MAPPPPRRSRLAGGWRRGRAIQTVTRLLAARAAPTLPSTHTPLHPPGPLTPSLISCAPLPSPLPLLGLASLIPCACLGGWPHRRRDGSRCCGGAVGVPLPPPPRRSPPRSCALRPDHLPCRRTLSPPHRYWMALIFWCSSETLICFEFRYGIGSCSNAILVVVLSNCRWHLLAYERVFKMIGWS